MQKKILEICMVSQLSVCLWGLFYESKEQHKKRKKKCIIVNTSIALVTHHSPDDSGDSSLHDLYNN